MADVATARLYNRLGQARTVEDLTTLFDLCLVVVDGVRPAQLSTLAPVIKRIDRTLGDADCTVGILAVGVGIDDALGLAGSLAERVRSSPTPTVPPQPRSASPAPLPWCGSRPSRRCGPSSPTGTTTSGGRSSPSWPASSRGPSPSSPPRATRRRSPPSRSPAPPPRRCPPDEPPRSERRTTMHGSPHDTLIRPHHPRRRPVFRPLAATVNGLKTAAVLAGLGAPARRRRLDLRRGRRLRRPAARRRRGRRFVVVLRPPRPRRRRRGPGRALGLPRWLGLTRARSSPGWTTAPGPSGRRPRKSFGDTSSSTAPSPTESTPRTARR